VTNVVDVSIAGPGCVGASVGSLCPRHVSVNHAHAQALSEASEWVFNENWSENAELHQRKGNLSYKCSVLMGHLPSTGAKRPNAALSLADAVELRTPPSKRRALSPLGSRDALGSSAESPLSSGALSVASAVLSVASVEVVNEAPPPQPAPLAARALEEDDAASLAALDDELSALVACEEVKEALADHTNDAAAGGAKEGSPGLVATASTGLADTGGEGGSGSATSAGDGSGGGAAAHGSAGDGSATGDEPGLGGLI